MAISMCARKKARIIVTTEGAGLGGLSTALWQVVHEIHTTQYTQFPNYIQGHADLCRAAATYSSPPIDGNPQITYIIYYMPKIFGRYIGVFLHRKIDQMPVKWDNIT